MAKLSTLVAAAAILAFAGSSALACEYHDKTAQQSSQVSTQTAQNPATTATTPKTEDATD